MKKIITDLLMFTALLLTGFLLGFPNSHASVSQQRMVQIYLKLTSVNHLSKPSLYVIKDPEMNGYATKYGIYITQGSMRLLSEDQLAETLGHELTHVKFEDYKHNVSGKIQEDRADFYGAIYASNIGYNRCKMAKKFLLWYKMYGNQGSPNDPHSSNLTRYNNMNKGCK